MTEETQLKNLLRAEAHKPFDLTQDLMLRAVLIRVGPEKHILSMTAQQMAVDAQSMKILCAELVALCSRKEQGASPGHDLPVQYADYTIWQHHATEAKALEEQAGLLENANGWRT